MAIASCHEIDNNNAGEKPNELRRLLVKQSGLPGLCGASLLYRALCNLSDMYENLDNLLKLTPLPKDVSDQWHEYWLDEFPHMLDIWDGARNIISQMKGSTHNLQSALRRSRGSKFTMENEVSAYISSTKKMKNKINKWIKSWKMAECRSAIPFSACVDEQAALVMDLMGEVKSISETILQSLFYSVLGAQFRGRKCSSKWISRRQVTFEEQMEKVYEPININAFLHALQCNSSKYLYSLEVVKYHSQLAALGAALQDIENGFECAFRSSIKLIGTILNLINR